MPEIRKIIHCDFDCFYAAIEMRDNPELRNKPIAVGGSPGRRGVIATCNYQARDYGIHSAMASAQALKLCPELILIHGDMEKYKTVSRQAHEIFKRYSDIIEPLSLDEAFIDVSENKKFNGSATLLAQAIRKDIENELCITASAGIAPNKFLAKVASDWNKPNGQFTISPEQIDTFMHGLPVKKIFGVGKVTQRKMLKLGIETCGDLQKLNKPELAKHFGSFGNSLYLLCRGIDQRPVKTSRIRKSISVEHTYQTDISCFEHSHDQFIKLENELFTRFEKISDRYHPVTVFVKLKFSDFTQTTVEKTTDAYSSDIASALLKVAFDRKKLGVRLIGLGMKLKPNKHFNEQQFELL